jgi:flavin-dependent dehydrogenase
MTTKKAIALGAVLLFVGFTSGLAQTSGQLAGEELLRALLAEMRALRQTIQQNGSNELRGRFLLERTRVQAELVRELQRDVEQRTMSTSVMEDDGMEQYIEDLEERLRDAPPEQKRQLERERDQLRRRREMQKRQVEEARLRQQRIEQRLAEEREKLETLEAEIATLQREMTK